MNNRVLGVTGGIGSGKSVVSHLLEIMGIPVYNCDEEAKRLNNIHPQIRSELSTLVGNEVYQPNGGILNKKVLASFLFEDASHVAQVNAIIHPRVKEHFIQWKNEHASFKWVGIESAILFEAGFTDLVDKVLMVYAPEELRIRRAMYRDGASEEDIRKRISHQMADEEKRKLSTLTVINDDESPLIPQIFDILALLLC